MTTTTTTTPSPCQTSSALSQILAGLKAEIEAIPCLGSVVTRSGPIFNTNDTLPLIILSPSQGESIAFRYFGSICWNYQISINLVQAGNRNFSIGTGDGIDTRAKLRDTLNKITLQLTDYKIFDREIKPFTPVLMPATGSLMNYKISRFDLFVKVIEPQYGI